jgi:Zn finger protein HypA/HybF involved in hydrogenase expression
MKKKTKEVPVISEEIIEQAKRAIHTDQAKPAAKCKVCDGEAAPNSTEGLCWVCRRLKISAWRESEQQMPAQE